MMKNELIRVEDVRKVYNQGSESQVTALDGVSLTISEGDYVVVTGPSGSGKTTLLQLMGCMDAPTSGRVLVRGVETGGDEDALADVRRKTVGFVFQSYHLLETLTVLENVLVPRVPGGVSGEDRIRAVELLALMGLEGKGGVRSGHLSGGEQQRVAICRALINRPPLLLADEPTGNLDSATGSGIIELFERLNREEGVSVVMVTHNMEIASRAKRRIQLRDGRLASQQTFSE